MTDKDKINNVKNNRGSAEEGEIQEEIMEDEIDLTQIFLDLVERWKMILSITFAGTIVAVVIALAIPKVYKPSAAVSQPTAATIERISHDELLKINAESLFKDYYQALRSEQNFRSYVINRGLLESFAKEADLSDDQVKQQALARLTENLSVAILEPTADKNETIKYPELVSVALNSKDEALAVQTVNQYLDFTNGQVIAQLVSEYQIIIDERLREIERQIELARQREKNNLQLRIEQIEAEQQIKLKELQLEKETTLQLAKQNRQTQIAEVEEAFKIAQKLGIENPTPIDELTGDQRRDVSTSITLNQSQELPLYLMGTRYLESLITTLSERKNDAQFLKILNELDKQIQKIKQDPELIALKARTNFDPFIEELPSLMASRDRLKSYQLNFQGLDVYQTEKLASVSGKAIKPNRPLIAVLGLVLSGMVAFFAALISASVARRKEREQEEANSSRA